MRRQAGQAAVEWLALLLVVAGALAALPAVALPVDGRSFGGFLAHRVVCAVKRGCDDGDAALARAYGRREAELVRAHAPSIAYEQGEGSLPMDWRRCRARRCADAPDEPDLDAHRSRAGQRATVFTRVVRRRRRTYLQYWLYYPDSNTSWAGSDRLWERSVLLPLAGRLLRGDPTYPGFHRDDWEGYAVRIDPDGSVWARASSHGHWQGCKQRRCRGRWMRGMGWTRVSRGSHAGHLPIGDYPGHGARERTTTGEGLRLLPLETLDTGGYRRLDRGVSPPWRKPAYRDPEGGAP